MDDANHLDKWVIAAPSVPPLRGHGREREGATTVPKKRGIFEDRPTIRLSEKRLSRSDKNTYLNI